MKKNYTYVNFANDCINMANKQLISVDIEVFIEKAQALLTAQTNKATSASKKTSNGVGEKTQKTIDLITQVLDETPKTTSEINEELGTNLSPIQISGAIKFMDGVETMKVKRKVTDAQGLISERLYTAYYRTNVQ